MPFTPPTLRIALVCLHTSPNSDPGSGDAGGMNVVVKHQAEALAKLGHSVEILTRRSSPELSDPTQMAPGVVLRFLEAGPVEPISKGDHEDYIAEFGAQLAALGPYDVYHSHHWFSGMAALPIARERGIPHLQSFHSIAAADSTPLSAGERAESPGRMAGEAWLARESDAVIAISDAEAETVRERLGGVSGRITVVLPGVDSALFHPAEHGSGASETGERRSGIDGSTGYAVVAARLQPLKGLDLAIEAIACVPAEHRPSLVIAGDASADFDGYTNELTRLATTHGIADGIRFVGPQGREALAALLRDARLILVPSHSETYGLVALEGAASGVPVIAADAGGLREAVVDEVTGLVLKSRDACDWATAITRVLTEPGLAKRFSEAARARAEHFDWARSAVRLAAVYTSAINQHRADGHGTTQ